MSNIKNGSFTPKTLQSIESYYYELDVEHEEKSQQLFYIRKDIKNLEKLIKLIKELEDYKTHEKERKNLLNFFFDIGIIVTCKILLFITETSILYPFFIFGLVSYAITHLITYTVTHNDEYINTVDEDISELESILKINKSLDHYIVKVIAKDLLKRKEITKDTLRIELETLKQKANYFNNLIKQIDFYLDFPTYEKKYNEIFSFMQHNPCLIQIIKEVEEEKKEEMDKKRTALIIEKEWQNHINSYKSYTSEYFDISKYTKKEENNNLTGKEWQDYIDKAGSYKSYNQNFDIPSIKLEYKKD